MNTTDYTDDFRDALIEATKRDLAIALTDRDLRFRNVAIGRLRSLDVPVTEIAALADVTTPTVYRISVNWEPDMSEEFEAEEAAQAHLDAQAAPAEPEAPADNADLLAEIRNATTPDERNAAIVKGADLGISRDLLAEAAGLKKVGNIIRAARSEK